MSLLDVPPPPYTDNNIRRSKSVGSPLPSPRPRSQSQSQSQAPSTRRPKQRKHVADVIDRLDNTSLGGAYHHQGPYDAALRSYNLNSKFSPVAATREGNRAAWDATPREAQLDALLRGRPLDGVAIVPPGERAMNGQVMRYEDGPDLMREMSPGGGAYKRWPGLQYHPDDLKGKGEPGFTIDNERKAREAAGIGRSRSARHGERRGEYEMVSQQPSPRGVRPGGKDAPVLVRQRSASLNAMGSSSSSRPSASLLKEGLKRRLGSLKRK